jgi:SAM-dependent methyltransferase
MRRVTVNILRCPRCRRGSLLPETDTAEVLFGPLRCTECQATHPVSEGVADLVELRGHGAGVQRSLEQAWVARGYERYLRPAIQVAMARKRVDRDSEYLVYRSLLGEVDGPILDLGCGTGLFTRRLAREEGPPVIGMDVSKPMIEESIAQAREAGVMIDFVRAEAPFLPFLDHTLGAVLQTASLQLIEDAERLFSEVARVLRPGGRYVASTYLPPGRTMGALHRRAGLHPRSEDALRGAASAAGLVRFERVKVAPFIVFKAERTALHAV